MKVPKLVRQGLIYASAKLFGRLILFIALALFARGIGPSHYGVFTYVLTTATMFAGFSAFGGVGYLVKRYITGEDVLEEMRESFLTVALLNIPLALVPLLLIKIAGYSWILAFSGAALCFLHMLYVYEENLHFISGRIRFASIASILQRLVTAIGMLVLPSKTLFMIFSYFLGFLTSLTYLILKLPPKIVKKLNLSIVKPAFLLPSLLLLIASKLPPIITGIRFGMKNLGYFGAAINIVFGINFVVQETMKVIGIRGVRAREKYRKGIIAASFLSALVFLALLFLKPAIILVYKLIYGESFASGAVVLFYLLLTVPANIVYEISKYRALQKRLLYLIIIHAVYAASVVISSLIAPDFISYIKLVALSRYLEALTAFFLSL